jgi:hypothetical protein
MNRLVTRFGWFYLMRIGSSMPKLKLKIRDRFLKRHHALGLYYMGERRIEIDPRQRPKRYLNTLIHEIMHDRLPNAGENQINRIAGMLTEAIWKANYRRISV